jgi:hypothetical protein
MTGENREPSRARSRWVPRNVRSRGGAIGFAIFYLALAAAAGAWIAATDTALMRWLWGAVSIGALALSGMYWFAASNLPPSPGRSAASR